METAPLTNLIQTGDHEKPEVDLSQQVSRNAEPFRIQ